MISLVSSGDTFRHLQNSLHGLQTRTIFLFLVLREHAKLSSCLIRSYDVHTTDSQLVPSFSDPISRLLFSTVRRNRIFYFTWWSTGITAQVSTKRITFPTSSQNIYMFQLTLYKFKWFVYYVVLIWQWTTFVNNLSPTNTSMDLWEDQVRALSIFQGITNTVQGNGSHIILKKSEI
jgi:hypothetical protein